MPDSTTVFERKGDVLSLGELVLPADAQLHVSASQVLVSAPGQGAAGGSHQQTQLGSPYAAAQAHLDGLLARVINHPVAGAAAADAQTSEAQRSAGVPWKLPPHKAPSGGDGGWGLLLATCAGCAFGQLRCRVAAATASMHADRLII